MLAHFDLNRRRNWLHNEVYFIRQRYGGDVYIDETGARWLFMSFFPLPPGWNKGRVSLLLDIPYERVSYPITPPQWFWVDKDLTHKDGTSVAHLYTYDNTERGQRLIEKNWGHFCLHITSWYPNTQHILRGDNLLTYLSVLSEVFKKRHV